MRPSNDDRWVDDQADRGYLVRLRKLIGRDCRYLGKHCLVVDLLTDERLLILEIQERLPPIRTDQYGQATYRSNELLQIPIFGNDDTCFSEEIMDLFACLGTGQDQNESTRL
jgi:hypothetical protein